MSEPDKKWVTNADLELELRALRSDVKLWILASVALNQFLAGVDLPSSVTAAVIGAFVVKTLVSLALARLG
jgi:hypothetical protein